MRTYDTPRYEIGPSGEHLLKWEPTPLEVITKQVADKIAADREGKFRAALISLGWTPPNDPPR